MNFSKTYPQHVKSTPSTQVQIHFHCFAIMLRDRGNFSFPILLHVKTRNSGNGFELRCRTGCHNMSDISTAHVLVIFIISSPLLIYFVTTNSLQLMVFLTTVTQILLTFLAPSSHAQCEFSMTKLKVNVKRTTEI